MEIGRLQKLMIRHSWQRENPEFFEKGWIPDFAARTTRWSPAWVRVNRTANRGRLAVEKEKPRPRSEWIQFALISFRWNLESTFLWVMDWNPRSRKRSGESPFFIW